MPTTTNYSWTTPADTDLVKDGASAIRTLGSAIDTTTKNLNPSTTLGDIEYRSSTANTNTRLAIGTTGQVLTVSGGVPAWGSAPAAGANWSLLNTGGTNLTGAQTITVSSIPSGTDKIMVLLEGGSSASGSSQFLVRFNTDTGSNYYMFGYALEIHAVYQTNWASYLGSQARTGITMVGNGATGNTQLSSGALTMTGCNSSGVKAYQLVGGPGSHVNGGFISAQGYYNSSSVISSVSLFSDTGNWDAGKMYVYTSA